MSKICSKCQKAVYPLEELKCLDKVWHKLCFKCTECGMLLNMKNYKGYDKRPYCVAHYPRTKATAVAETPELARVAQNTKQQSMVKYHEEFEKKIKGSKIEVTDDPETQRVMKVNALVSQLEYTGKKVSAAPPLAKKPKVEGRLLADAAVQNGDKFSPFSSRCATSSTVYSSDGNKAVRPPQTSGRVGSIADYDPMNENYGSLAKGYKPASRQTSQAQEGDDEDTFTTEEPSSGDREDMTTSKADQTPDRGEAAPTFESSKQEEDERDVAVPERRETQEDLVTFDLADEHKKVEDSPERSHGMTGHSSKDEAEVVLCKDEDEHERASDVGNDVDDQAACRETGDEQQLDSTAEVLGVDDGEGGEIITTPLPGQFIALYDYEAQDDDEVTFLEDDVIVEVEKIDEGWLLGTVSRTGQRGMLPANYVQARNE